MRGRAPERNEARPDRRTNPPARPMTQPNSPNRHHAPARVTIRWPPRWSVSLTPSAIGAVILVASATHGHAVSGVVWFAALAAVGGLSAITERRQTARRSGTNADTSERRTTRAQLLQSIRDVASGQASIHPSIAVKVIHEFDQPYEEFYSTETLTRRELEALRLIARGLSNQEIANTLVVNERTIAKYVSSILNKLHVANRTQAALYAVREGLALATVD